jgi:hypothetical protein
MREVPWQPLEAAHSTKAPALPEDAYCRAKSGNRADYYTVLSRKIQEIRDNPVKMREVIYEAARLALKCQIQEQWPAVSAVHSNSHIEELENAIARLEVDAAGRGGSCRREPDKAAPDLNASRQSRNVKCEKENAAFRIEPPHPRPWDEPRRGQADLSRSRELNHVLPKRACVINPADLFNLLHRFLVVPQSGARMAVSGLLIAFQLGVATLAVAAFYVATWGRDSPVQTVKETPTAEQSSPRPTRPPASNAVAAALPAAAPTAAPPDGRVPIVAASLAAVPLAAAPPDTSFEVVTALPAAQVSFPRPTFHGVYAISENRLIELKQVRATPVDTRAGTYFRSSSQVAASSLRERSPSWCFIPILFRTRPKRCRSALRHASPGR